MQNRLKSKVVWMSILPIIILLGDTFGAWNIIGIPKDSFSQLYISIISLFATIGILNNPTSYEKF